MPKVTEEAIGNSRTMSGGRGQAVACRYDDFRAALLDAVRRRWGGEWQTNKSLVVMEALDRLLKEEGLLPHDAPMLAEIKMGREL